jgi:hypothetical protein
VPTGAVDDVGVPSPVQETMADPSQEITIPAGIGMKLRTTFQQSQSHPTPVPPVHETTIKNPRGLGPEVMVEDIRSLSA